jgi:membrane protein
MTFKKSGRIAKTVFRNWFNDTLFTHAAAAGYYAVFSVPGLILIATAIASLVFDEVTVQDEVNQITRALIGRELSFNIYDSLAQAQIFGRQWLAFLIGFAIILYAASRFFMQLHKSLNHVWGVIPRKRQNLSILIRKRFISVVLVLASGLVLLTLMAITSLLGLLSDYIALQIPIIDISVMVILNLVISYCIVVLLFTLLYKIVPDVKIRWRSAFFGAIISAAMFIIGQSLVNYYFTIADPQSIFGAAGSLILLMIWVSYAFIIIMLGAHVSKAHMQDSGQIASPDSHIAKSGTPIDYALREPKI